jgi:hypothetical protein
MALTGVSTSVVDMSGDTTGLVIAKGTTAERDAISSPQAGMIRNNTEADKVEVYNGTAWRNLVEAGNATPPLNIDYLIVAGGGAGKGGGGGAGGMIEGSKENVTFLNTVMQLTVGSGGQSAYSVSNGEDSELTIDANEGAIVSTGGGQGGLIDSASSARSGGSGGGGGPASQALTLGGLGNTPSTNPPQGYDGGTNGNWRGSTYPSGGGGGAGAIGGSATSNTQSGNGGDGRQSSITGTPTYYAGGGGGGMYNSINGAGSGGLGGGGDGYRGTVQAIQQGTPNTGGGGGGDGRYNNGGNGGSGVVILRYPSAYTITFQTGVGFISSTATLSATSEKVTTITAGSGTITFA